MYVCWVAVCGSLVIEQLICTCAFLYTMGLGFTRVRLVIFATWKAICKCISTRYVCVKCCTTDNMNMDGNRHHHDPAYPLAALVSLLCLWVLNTNDTWLIITYVSLKYTINSILRMHFTLLKPLSSTTCPTWKLTNITPCIDSADISNAPQMWNPCLIKAVIWMPQITCPEQ